MGNAHNADGDDERGDKRCCLRCVYVYIVVGHVGLYASRGSVMGVFRLLKSATNQL